MENQLLVDDLNVNFDEHIDLYICSASFEDRCFSIANQITKKRVLPKTVLICYNTNEYKLIVDNAFKLKNLFPKRSVLIPLDSNNSFQNSLNINQTLDDYFSKKRKVKNIFVDITTFTHETLLILLRLLHFKRDQYTSLFIGYVGAADYSTNEKADVDKWLSTGISEIRSVIGYPGLPSPAKFYHLIILFGFEQERTKKLIDDYQFDKVSIGFGATPIDQKHLEINVERHKELLSQYPYAGEFHVDLTNPLKAKNQILDQVKKYSQYNTVVAPMNNKISTIGAGLAAIENRKIQLIYAKPVKYNFSGYSASSGKAFIYQIF